MSSRCALVVGGTSGIGKGIALSLAKKGNINITIAGRSTKRGEEIVTQLQSISPDSQHDFVSVNAFDLNSVKQLANRFIDTPKKLDLLVMTQGMATTQGYTPTVDNIDQKLQLHYFSRIYLAKILAPNMSVKGRILTVLSAGVHNKYGHFKTDFGVKENYSIKNASDAAGFYNDAGFDFLSSQYPELTVCHAAPGFVNTNWGAEFPIYLRGVVRCLQPFGRSLEKCGDLLVSGWLNLEDAGMNDGKKYYLIDQDGKVVLDGIKHTELEKGIIWNKTLELLPKED